MLGFRLAAWAALPLAIIPKPVKLTPGLGAYVLSPGYTIAAPHGAFVERGALERELGIPATEANGGPAAVKLVLSPADTALGAEGYRLRSSLAGVEIDAAAPAGLFYGVQTLRQLALPDQGGWLVPAVQIVDHPRYRWRGLMLDCSRHFWTVPVIENLLDQMARYKLNVFQWHLTDDQGWRLEVPKYPKLTSVGAWRDGTMGRSDVSDGVVYGGFYTESDVRAVVGYAAERHIAVVPEIEMPGHCTAALAAYPELSCTGGPYQVAQRWGVHEDAFCLGHDRTFEFLKDVLDEVMELFPSNDIHIDADEVPKASWEECPRCQARMELMGFTSTTQLQSYFVKRLNAYVRVRGHRLVGWDDILIGGLAPGAVVMSWHGDLGAVLAARQGNDAVMTPAAYCYFDHAQSPSEADDSAPGGLVTLQKVYSLNPTPSVLTAKQGAHILGVQGNVWTEYIDSPGRLQEMVFPRALALAEVAWSPQGLRNFPDFQRRLAAQSPASVSPSGS